MKERPILFSAPMVRAILDGSKTQTRRAASVSEHLYYDGDKISRIDYHLKGRFVATTLELLAALCPYGAPGERLWVRESWRTGFMWDDNKPNDITPGSSVSYDADGKAMSGKNRVSIHMPRWACRIELEITEVRVERLQDISLGDIDREGTPAHFPSGASKDDFEMLWNSVNGPRAWAANPWVWALTFRRIKP